MAEVFNGIDVLIQSSGFHSKIAGDFGYLCHNASVTKDLKPGIVKIQQIFGKRLKKIFGPQHGFSTDVQDNMVETQDFIHPYFNLPVHSLYSHTRIPTDEMLEGLETLVVDLQDVGTRVYTYISTLYYLLRACGKKGIRVVILDRVNPIGELVEGAILDPEFSSFVGVMEIPQRHGLTMGEVARFALRFYEIDCEIEIIPVKNWKRNMLFSQTGLHWVMPSPNLPVAEGCIAYAGSVLFEGTVLSEGRGTVRSLEIIGHPRLEPYSFCEKLNREFSETGISLPVLRPTTFIPTFNKHQGKVCGGFQIHFTDDPGNVKIWTACQWICRALFHTLKPEKFWNDQPYEYEFEKLAIDLINGTDRIRKWVEKSGSLEELREIEQEKMPDYLKKREEILIRDYE